MSRPFQFAVDEHYHVYNRGTEKREIFLNKFDYDRFLALLHLCNSSESVHMQLQGRTLKEIPLIPRNRPLVALGAYCLMPNHFHLLLKETSAGGISKFMQKLITAYTMYFNIRYERSGTLFQGKFKARHANSDVYLQYLYAYIHLNPLDLSKNKLTKKGVSNEKAALDFLKKYKYSSYLDFIGTSERGVLLDQSVFPENFYGRDFSTMIQDWVRYRFLYMPEEEKKTSRSNLEGVRGFVIGRILISVAVLMTVALIAFAFSLKPYVVSGVSMENTFQGGDRLLVSRLLIDVRGVKRGDVVVFQRGKESDIKRVVGVPGDHIVVSARGVTITDKDAQTFSAGESGRSDMVDRYLGADEYFVMGDNRGHSEDSRTWGGAVLPSMIVGIPFIRIMPTSRFTLLPGAL